MKHQRSVLHYPKLDTILMVEETIKQLEIYPNKRQLWLKLPRKVMYQTFLLILDYLEKSGKIMLCKNGSIIWTWNPELLARAVPLK